MKKLMPLSLALLLASCSGLKRTPQASVPQNDAVAETAQLNDEIFLETEKPTENTHQLVDANADDVVITQAQGDKIDDELEPTKEEQIPYARNFLANRKTKRMKFWVEYFTQKQRDRFQRFINNGEEYRHHIEEVFVKNGLPKELYYVGLIESGYYLTARSHAKAVGPWQFMPGTGKQYGLKLTPELDERQDLFKATHAAAHYFKNLHNIFSSWELALSAYNAGEYGIIRRILKHGTRDFYKMSKNKLLPDETINYVPKVLAAMHVVQNAEKYGFIIPKKEHRLFDRTELRPIKKNVSLNVIADKLNVDVHLLRKLNPELRISRTPKRFAGTYFLRVPKTQYDYRLIGIESGVEVAKTSERPETKKELKRRTASLEVETSVRPSSHKVKRGETLVSIARKYEMTPRELASLNSFKNWKTKVKAGQTLALKKNDVPKVVSVKFSNVPKVRVTNSPIVYKVKSGDSLKDLARVFNITSKKLTSANRLKSPTLRVGQRLVLPSTIKGIYTVRRGDHLSKVARDFNQPIEALVKYNSLKKRQIYPGQKIIVDAE